MKFKSQIVIVIILIQAYSMLGQKKISTEDLIRSYNIPGFIYLTQWNYDSAEYYLLKTLELQEAYLGKMHKNTAATHVNLGVMYRNLNNFQRALKHLNTAESYFIENEPNSQYLGYIYNNKGNIYYSYSDYKEAELYYSYCIEFFKNNHQELTDAYERAYINLFNILVAQNKNNEAITFLNELILKSQDKKITFERHIFLTEAYTRLNNYKLALKEVEQAKLIYEKYLHPNLAYLAKYNYRIAYVLVQLGNYDSALDYLMQNINISDNNTTISFEKLYKTYLLIGNIHYLKGNYENCISWLSTIINNISEQLTRSTASNNFLNERSFNTDVIDYYRLYGNASHQLYYQTNDIDYLIASLENYTKSIDYLKVFRLHMRNEVSVHLESETRLSIIHEAVDVAAKLYKLTGDFEYLEKAFMYAENMKSFSLFTEIKGGEAMQFSDLPKKIRDKEDMLTRKLEAYNELIHKENLKEDSDKEILANFNDSYFKLKDSYNKLIDSIENFYPKYFELKYNPVFFTPREVQKKLGRKECLVEYVLSDTLLTTFVIDKHNIQVLTREIDPDFPEKCFTYYNILQNQDFSNNVHETYRQYVRLGHLFYETLVAPVLEVTESREITFVPDGAIMYLPFESMITSLVDEEYINYRDLPYLIYDVSVGYSHSSTLLFNERFKTRSPQSKVLAFAPQYENLMDGEFPLVWNRQSNPDFLMPLPGAEEEVNYISRTVPSDVYMDYEATESNFKKLAPDYSVLHLAMHTIMNDENPMYSKLAFARNWSDTTQDHDLFTYEIYNMKLNAEMVVLSSCSSGYGKMQKGEGMMSMARGFIYAGCPSIVMTLWQVSDRSSAELMTGFYKNLKKGKSKKQALRQAKIDYIQSSDKLKANPYFWSAFMMVGNNAPLYRDSAGFYLALVITGFLSIVLYFSYKKQIRGFINRKVNK